MAHQSEYQRLTRHYEVDCGGTVAGLLDALALQFWLKVRTGAGRIDDAHRLTRFNGGCWDCEELGRRLGILSRS